MVEPAANNGDEVAKRSTEWQGIKKMDHKTLEWITSKPRVAVTEI